MIYAFEGFELDGEAYELRRQGRLVKLEPQVFDVLRYLVEHRDRVVGKEELLDEIWGTRFVTESALTTRVKEVRQALGDDGRAQRIVRTVTGRGYRFVGEVVGSVGDATGSAGADDGAPALLLGRDHELGELDAALADAAAGRRRVVLVSGDAGTGKTSLVQAFAAGAGRSRGALVATGQSIEHAGATEPYLPLLDALSRLCRRPGSHEVVATLRRCAPTWLMQLPGLLDDDEAAALQRRTLGATPARMARELLEALEELSRRRPVVLVLEDLHWADAASVELLAASGRRHADARLLVVGTYRPGGPDANGLHAVVADLAPRRPACRLLELRGLGRDEATSLLRSRWGATSVPGSLADLVVDRADGNPLFMTALADHWLATGLVAVEEAGAVPAPDLAELAATVPADLRLLIEQQAATLPAGDREVLDAASVVGHDPSAAAVGAALDIDAEAAEQRLAALAERSILVSHDDPVGPDATAASGFGFRHSLFQQVVYERVPPLRRARAHARVGAHLERSFGLDDPAHAGEIARHLTAGGDVARAVPALVSAATVALRRSGHREAVALLEQARAAVARVEDGAERDRWEAQVLALLAPSLVATQGWAAEEARTAYERAVELGRALPDPTLLDSMLYGLATLHEYRAEYDRSHQLMEERLRLGAAGAPARVEAHELLACSSFHQGNFREALDHTDSVLADYDPDQHLALMALHGENPAVSTRHWAALAQWFLGYPDRALRTMEEALTLAADRSHSFSLSHAHEHAAYLFQHRGEPEGARRHAETTIRLAAEAGYVYRHATGTMMRGWALAATDPEAGLAELDAGLAAYRATGAAMDLPYFLALRAGVLIRLGRLDRASDALDAADAVNPPDRRYYYQPELLRLRAEVLRRGGAAGWATPAWHGVEAARSLGARSLELRTAMTLVAGADDEPARAAALTALEAVHGTFDDGLDTPELRRAARLLDRAG
jgi:DNA-binding winged helix-turn-helix (wHTH) protein/tetratricopeptide (TPR) repeat protein